MMALQIYKRQFMALIEDAFFHFERRFTTFLRSQREYVWPEAAKACYGLRPQLFELSEMITQSFFQTLKSF